MSRSTPTSAQSSTVIVTLRAGATGGTGFFVADGLVLTARHVVGASPAGEVHTVTVTRSSDPDSEQDRDAVIVPMDEMVQADVALVRTVLRGPSLPCGSVECLGERISAVGYPSRSKKQHWDEVSGTVEQLDHQHPNDPWRAGLRVLKFKGGHVIRGFSGSPLLSLDTGRVVGVVSTTRDDRSDLGGLAVPLAGVLHAWSVLDEVRIAMIADDSARKLRADEAAKRSADREDVRERYHRELLNSQVSLLQALQRDKGVPYKFLRDILIRLGEENVPDEQIEELLVKQVERFLAAHDGKGRLGHLGIDESLYDEKFEAGDFVGADKVLRDAADRLRARREDDLRAEAEVLARRARLDLLQLRYRIASLRFAEAAELVRTFDAGELGRLLSERASALYDQGNELGDNEALREAAIAYQAALRERSRERNPLDWASIQNGLGNALRTLGERESETGGLERAVVAYEAALEVRTRERWPLEWAMTQNNLGTALSALGQRESGTLRLEKAVEAHRAALEEYTRERVPLDWAMAQNNLGNALSTLGERASGTASLEQAVEAFSAALEVRTRERKPLEWAMTQNNLGNALTVLGKRAGGTAYLEQAVQAYCAALEVRTRERVPLQWATTQNNLGSALSVLGNREAGTARLEKAVEAYREALAERTRERVPLQWATTQNNLGSVLITLGQREGGSARLIQAVDAHLAALSELTRERVPLEWAMTQNNLGGSLLALGEREGGSDRLEKAVEAFRAALQVRTREHAPLQSANTQNNLARALCVLAERAGDAARLEDALAAYRVALEITERVLPEEHELMGMVRTGLGLVTEKLGSSAS